MWAHDWFPKELDRAYGYTPAIPYISDRYCSISLRMGFPSESPLYSTFINTTVDMQTGTIVFLDDLIDVNEKLAKRILTSGIARNVGSSPDTFRRDRDPFSQYYLNTFDTEDVLGYLRACSVPFDAENYVDKPTFWLEADRLYLVNVLPAPPNAAICYISLYDLEHFLKVDRW